MIDGFERASALALFHGNIALAVQVNSKNKIEFYLSTLSTFLFTDFGKIYF